MKLFHTLVIQYLFSIHLDLNNTYTSNHPFRLLCFVYFDNEDCCGVIVFNVNVSDRAASIQLLCCLNWMGLFVVVQLVLVTVVVDDGIIVCGTRWGVRLDIGGNIGLVGH